MFYTLMLSDNQSQKEMAVNFVQKETLEEAIGCTGFRFETRAVRLFEKSSDTRGTTRAIYSCERSDRIIPVR